MGCLECPFNKKSKRKNEKKEINQKSLKFKTSKKENLEDKASLSIDSKAKILSNKLKENTNIDIMHSIKSQRFKAKNKTKTKFGFDETQIISDIKPSNSMKINNKNNKNTKGFLARTISSFFGHGKEENSERKNKSNRSQEEDKIIKYMKAPTREDLLNEDNSNDTKNLINKNNELMNIIEKMQKEKEELQQQNLNLKTKKNFEKEKEKK